MAKLAFVERDMVEGEGPAREVAALCQKGCDRSRAAIEPRERDVRHESARFGGNADAGEPLIDLAVQRGERFERLD